MGLSGRCRYHPQRDGVGICMRCRAVICSECSTKIDGINHCVRCLAQLHAEAAPARRTAGAGPARAVALTLLFGVCFALVLLLTYAMSAAP
jgi:hypothetical protein